MVSIIFCEFLFLSNIFSLPQGIEKDLSDQLSMRILFIDKKKKEQVVIGLQNIFRLGKLIIKSKDFLLKSI